MSSTEKSGACALSGQDVRPAPLPDDLSTLSGEQLRQALHERLQETASLLGEEVRASVDDERSLLVEMDRLERAAGARRTLAMAERVTSTHEELRIDVAGLTAEERHEVQLVTASLMAGCWAPGEIKAALQVGTSTEVAEEAGRRLLAVGGRR